MFEVRWIIGCFQKQKVQSLTKQNFADTSKFPSFQSFKRRKLGFQVFVNSPVVVDSRWLAELCFLLLVAAQSVLLSVVLLKAMTEYTEPDATEYQKW